MITPLSIPVIDLEELAMYIQCKPSEFSFSNKIQKTNMCYVFNISDDGIRELKEEIVWAATRDIPIFVEEYRNSYKAAILLRDWFDTDKIIVKG